MGAISTGAVLGASAIAAGANAAVQLGSSMKSLRKNKKFAEYQHELNMKAWREQAAYNTPEMQMRRLRAAGLNPNLAYGNGTIANTQDTPPPQYQAPTANFTPGNFDLQRPIELGLQALFQKSQIRQIEQSVATGKAQESLLAAETAVKLIEESQKMFDLGVSKELRKTTIDTAKAQLGEILKGIEKSDSEIMRNVSQTALNYSNSGYMIAKTREADAMADRIVQMTPREIDNLRSQTALNYSGVTRNKALNRLTGQQIMKMAHEVKHISQMISEGKSREALQKAELVMKQGDLWRIAHGIDPRISNPWTALVSCFMLSGETTFGTNPAEIYFGLK